MMITEQVSAGDDYSKIKPVVNILIADYELIPGDDHYRHRFRLYDRETNVELTDKIEIVTFELGKLTQEKERTALTDWLNFFKAESEEEFEMAAENVTEIRKAVGIIERLSGDAKIRALAEARDKAIRDEMNRMKGARQKGLQEGMREGRQKGMQGERQFFVQKMLAVGISAEDICRMTGYSKEDIERLIQDLCKPPI